MSQQGIPIISIVGWHNVGKTTFITQLILELKRRGLRIATIKHTRGDFQLDHEGTDTWRYAQAGSDVVAISGKEQLALLEHTAREWSLPDIISRLPADLDMVITEGYKEATTPKIEIVPSCGETKRISGAGELLAQVVGIPEARGQPEAGLRHGAGRVIDGPSGEVPQGTPCFQMDDVAAIVDLLVKRGLVPRDKS